MLEKIENNDSFPAIQTTPMPVKVELPKLIVAYSPTFASGALMYTVPAGKMCDMNFISNNGTSTSCTINGVMVMLSNGPGSLIKLNLPSGASVYHSTGVYSLVGNEY